MKANVKALRVAAAAFALAAGLLFFARQAPWSAGKKVIRVSGNIETTSVRLAFRAGGRIEALLVDEGQAVKKGDVVARLETDELGKVKAEAQATLKNAEFSLQRAQEDYERAESLFRDGALPTQKRDAAKTAADTARTRVEALKAASELAATRLGFAVLESPLDGVVLTKSAEAGEVVQPGSVVFTAADLDRVWLTAYVAETDLGRIRLGQEAEVTTDSYPGKIYRGRISFIAQEAEFTPKQIQTTAERVKLVFRIKITMENPGRELKPGMPADARIRTE